MMPSIAKMAHMLKNVNNWKSYFPYSVPCMEKDVFEDGWVCDPSSRNMLTRYAKFPTHPK